MSILNQTSSIYSYPGNPTNFQYGINQSSNVSIGNNNIFSPYGIGTAPSFGTGSVGNSVSTSTTNIITDPAEQTDLALGFDASAYADGTTAFAFDSPISPGGETDIDYESTILALDSGPMAETQPDPFDLGKDSTLQQDSLLSIPDESLYQDLDGVDQGNGYFNGINNPGRGQGKQIDGEDLHISLLKSSFEKSEFQSLKGKDGPIFNKGKEAEQDPSNPIIDTIHEQSLERKYKDPNNDLDLDGNTPKSFQGNTSNVDLFNRNSINKVPGGNSNSEYQDINGNVTVNTKVPDGAPIPRDHYFHGINNPTKLQGLEIGGVDLHEALLTQTITLGGNGRNPYSVGPSGGIGNRGLRSDLNGSDYGQGRYKNPETGAKY